MIKFNYILNDLALSSLITKCLYGVNVNYSDKEELENQIKLIQQENQQLIKDIKNIISILNRNCDDLETSEEEFESLDRWQNEYIS